MLSGTIFRIAATIRSMLARYLQHRRSRACLQSLRLANRLRARPGAQCHLSPHQQTHCAGAPDELRRHVSFRLSGAITDPDEAIPFPERFFGGGARTAPFRKSSWPRDTTPGSVGRPGPPFHQTEWRFPLFGENIGGVLFHDMGNVFTI
jgi:hypothetical protein